MKLLSLYIHRYFCFDKLIVICKVGIESFPQLLRGMFSFIIYDREKKFYTAVRDHMGITPLYIGYGADGSVWFASEMKALACDCVRFESFPPGHYYSSESKQFHKWYDPSWRRDLMPKNPYDKLKLRTAFETAVKRRMMSDVPWGVLLSGGLDSSLVAAVASRLMNSSSSPFPRLHSFCVGLEGSPDIEAALRVATFLGTCHHSYTYSIQEG